MSVKELRRLRKAAGITQDALAAKLGVNRATISKYETGQIEPTVSQLQAIADALGVHLFDLLDVGPELDKYRALLNFPGSSNSVELLANPRYLYDSLSPKEKGRFWDAFTGDEAEKNAPSEFSDEARKIARSYDRLSEHGKGAVWAVLRYEEAALAKGDLPDDTSSSSVISLPTAKRSGPMVQIQVYDQPAAAGLGNYLDEPESHVEQYPTKVIPPKTDFGVVISGDSMEPKVHNGGTVFVRAMPAIDPGQIGIFVLDGKAYCKKLSVDHQKREIRLVSLNPKYEDIIVREDYDDFRTLGRVLGQWTPGFQQDPFGW